MASKKARKQKRSVNAPKTKRRKFPSILMIFICVAIVGAGGWLFYNESGMRADLKPETSDAQTSSREAVQTVSTDSFKNLVGRWIRPDGGYIIEIRNVGTNGLMEAAYFNPRPIHVSQARLTIVNKKPQAFIELRDVGYPGRSIP